MTIPFSPQGIFSKELTRFDTLTSVLNSTGDANVRELMKTTQHDVYEALNAGEHELTLKLQKINLQLERNYLTIVAGGGE